MTQNLPTTGPRSMLEATFTIPVDVRMHMQDPLEETCTFRYTNPVHALVNMLHFNPLAEDWDNLCFGYEPQPFYDDFCNGDRVRRIQVHTWQLLGRCPDSTFPITSPTVFLTDILFPVCCCPPVVSRTWTVFAPRTQEGHMNPLKVLCG